MAPIQVGRFDQFKGADTLLIEVDIGGLATLVASFRALAERAQRQVEFHQLPGGISHGGTILIGEVSADDVGLCELRPAQLTWRRSSDGWADLASKLATLEGVSSGHQYLDGPSDGIQVIAAIGEYGDQWWIKHGGGTDPSAQR
jgi:hypothetical protein